MKKLHKSLVVVLVLATLTALTMLVPASAMAETVSPVSEYSEAAESAISAQANIAAPTLKYTVYNTAVRYEWFVGSGGDQLAMSSDSYYYMLTGKSYYCNDVFPSYGDKRRCVPENYLAKSYSSATGEYSAVTSTEDTVNTGNNTSITYYGYECAYAVVGEIDRMEITSGKTVPTSYDQDYYIWKHYGKSKQYIRGTITYDGGIANIEVKIPSIAYNTASVNINGSNGATFYLRTGPNKCSIKVDRSGISATSVHFAFGVA